MRRIDFWRPGQYPSTPPDNQPQPSDSMRWEQLREFWNRVRIQQGLRRDQERKKQ